MYQLLSKISFERTDSMSKLRKYIDIGDVEDFIEQTYHELIFDADKYRNYCKEILKKYESISDCNDVKIRRIKKIIKRHKERLEQYKSSDVINTIENILNEKDFSNEL